MARTVGAKNKIPQAAKENIQAVFVRLGGTAAMAKWAQDNQSEFYKIYARLLPVESQVSGPDGGPIVSANIDPSKLTDDQLRVLASIPVPSE